MIGLRDGYIISTELPSYNTTIALIFCDLLDNYYEFEYILKNIILLISKNKKTQIKKYVQFIYIYTD